MAIMNGNRNREIYQRWALYNETQEEIGERFGLDQSTISKIIKDWKLREHPDEAQLRERSLESLLEVKRRQLELADMEGAPVTAGKDGDVVLDPEDGSVVRDYSLRLNALAAVAKTDAEIAKRFGLDAAQKVEATNTVRYELAGVDVEDLK